MLDSRDCDSFRSLMKGKLISGSVTRSSQHIARQPPASSYRR
ncbi:hypothetical protein [Sphingobium ummariense]|uniref:Uncharacterized protein n=1 Tax=Sphingobium ummariense RL-3 TaxID=1346791 RepID=T0J2Q2_9SPHN|nr:hypothetical protein [Sphingobium ummariense]EQB32236.1 hypothetical protein M529_10560 [Sphingobium ummariense RL-3]